MQSKNKISDLALCDQPREKLMNKGAASLSNSEILAIILRSGTKEESVMELSSHIMRDCDNSFTQLSRLSIEELVNSYKGIGKVKAIQLAATSEILNRCKYEKLKKDDFTVRSSEVVYKHMEPLISTIEHEEFWVIYLNRSNKIIRKKKISSGGFTGTVTDVRIIFRLALEFRAVSIILCHNHPSGNINPSTADIKITSKIKIAGDTMDIKVLDHIIIAGKKYYGFADNGDI
ncbi:MAG: DNA repair protein RadC [Marinifilaceae bacterium]